MFPVYPHTTGLIPAVKPAWERRNVAIFCHCTIPRKCNEIIQRHSVPFVKNFRAPYVFEVAGLLNFSHYLEFAVREAKTGRPENQLEKSTFNKS